MTNGELSAALMKIASEVKSLATRLQGIDPNGIILEADTIAKGPGVEPDPRVFVWCGAPETDIGLKVIHFMKAMNGVANWVEDLNAPIADLDPSAPIGGMDTIA